MCRVTDLIPAPQLSQSETPTCVNLSRMEAPILTKKTHKLLTANQLHLWNITCISSVRYVSTL